VGTEGSRTREMSSGYDRQEGYVVPMGGSGAREMCKKRGRRPWNAKRAKHFRNHGERRRVGTKRRRSREGSEGADGEGLERFFAHCRWLKVEQGEKDTTQGGIIIKVTREIVESNTRGRKRVTSGLAFLKERKQIIAGRLSKLQQKGERTTPRPKKTEKKETSLERIYRRDDPGHSRSQRPGRVKGRQKLKLGR